MQTSNIGLIVDSTVGIAKFIAVVTKGTTNQCIYPALSGPIKYNFVQYDQAKEDSYDIVLLVVDPTKPLTKLEEQKLLSKLPKQVQRGLVTVNQDSTEFAIAQDVDPVFSVTINTTNSNGVDKLLYLLCQFTRKNPNIIYDAPHSIDKFEKYLSFIDDMRVIQFIPATNTQVCRDATESFKKPSDLPFYKWEDFDNTKTFEFGEQTYHWMAFKGQITVPSTYDPAKHIIRVKFAINRNYLCDPNNDDFPAGPEGRIWFNGEPVGAADSFHDSAIIKGSGPVEVRIFTARCKTSHSLAQFGLEITEKNTETLYYRLKFMDRLTYYLSDTNRDKQRLINLIEAAVRQLDIRDMTEITMKDIRKFDPTHAVFYASVPNALEILRSVTNIRTTDEKDCPTISVVGYSHIDTCWQWPYNISRYKSVNTITTMLHLQENPPDEFKNPVEWKFLATASQHYKWLMQDDPALFERVLKARDNGRWLIDGVSWLEHECVILSGESMIRQVLYGRRFFHQYCKADQTCLFLPDCFGFSAALPQVLQGFGIDTFITSKISWNEYNKFPYNTFVWKGNDGSEILAHFITSPAGWDPTVSCYTGTASVKELLGTYQCYKEKDVCRHAALHTAGNGDGGGGITEEMIWNFNLMNEFPHVDEVPKIQFPSLPELFSEIRQNKALLPVWDGELYLEYHRGTQTSQEESKRINRTLEANLRNAEFMLAVLYGAYGYKDEQKYQDTLRLCWENACLFQFHDALPGTTVNEATVDIQERGQAALGAVKEIEKALAEEIAAHERGNVLVSTVPPLYGYTVVNKQPKIDKYSTCIYKRTLDDDYKRIDLQHENIDPTVNEPFDFDISTKTVTTKRMKIQFNKYGGMSSCIVDGREFISDSVNPFFIYEDRPLQWPAWDIQLYHKEMQDASPYMISYSLTENNELIMSWELPAIGEQKAEMTLIKQVISFQGTTVDMKTYVQWTQHDKLLKYVIPTTIRARTCRFGLQFGFIERETQNNTNWDFARFEVPGRWADLSDSTGGITMCSDVKGGFDVHGHVMMMSLLKAPQAVDKWADFGMRRFIIRLDFHNQPFSARSQIMSDTLCYPKFFGRCNSSSLANDTPKSLITIENDKLILVALKKGEDEQSIVARFVEPIGGTVTCKVSFPFLSGSWTFWHADMGENTTEQISATGSQIQLVAKPFQVITVVMKKEQNQFGFQQRTFEIEKPRF